MRKEDLKHQIFTIPNILTYIRMLSIPVYMYFTIAKSSYILRSAEFPGGFPLIGLIIMVVAAATDVFDGMIARKFNQTSDLGTLLDPLADKLMHTMAALSLVIIGFVHWAFVVLMLVKEGLMIAAGILMANDSKLIRPVMMGKVASATISTAIFMCYFHPFFAQKVFYLDWIVLSIGVVLTYVAFSIYFKQALPIIKNIFAKKKAAKTGVSEENKEESNS
jgi:cardiolipin synthase